MIANRHRGDHLTSISVHYRHHFAAATNKQPAVGWVYRHAGGRSAWRGRPSLVDLELACVDLKHQALIFQIVVHESMAVRGCVLRTAAEIHRARDFAGCGIDRGRAVAAAIKGEHARGGGIENNRVWLLSRRNIANGFESFQIKNSDCRGLAIAHESTSKLRRDCDPVHARGVWNI